jgi:hypothetical protein
VNAERLLRLYPRRWRERYGDELLELTADQPLGIQQQFDLFMGAIDAHMSWTPSGSSTNVNNQEARVIAGLRTVCATKGARMTKRDGLIAAGLYLGVTILLTFAGIWLKRSGMDNESQIVMTMAFPTAMLFTLPTYMKGQPLRVQAVVMGTTFAILALISYLAFMLN